MHRASLGTTKHCTLMKTVVDPLFLSEMVCTITVTSCDLWDNEGLTGDVILKEVLRKF